MKDVVTVHGGGVGDHALVARHDADPVPGDERPEGEEDPRLSSPSGDCGASIVTLDTLDAHLAAQQTLSQSNVPLQRLVQSVRQVRGCRQSGK